MWDFEFRVNFKGYRRSNYDLAEAENVKYRAIARSISRAPRGKKKEKKKKKKRKRKKKGGNHSVLAIRQSSDLRNNAIKYGSHRTTKSCCIGDVIVLASQCVGVVHCLVVLLFC